VRAFPTAPLTFFFFYQVCCSERSAADSIGGGTRVRWAVLFETCRAGRGVEEMPEGMRGRRHTKEGT
jgi:hypothetical protein